jgi:hypothetical protein
MSTNEATPAPDEVAIKAKPKKPVSEAQLANLAKAREKYMSNRKALAELKAKEAKVKEDELQIRWERVKEEEEKFAKERREREEKKKPQAKKRIMHVSPPLSEEEEEEVEDEEEEEEHIATMVASSRRAAAEARRQKERAPSPPPPPPIQAPARRVAAPQPRQPTQDEQLKIALRALGLR